VFEKYVWADRPDFRDPSVMVDPFPHYQRMFDHGRPFYVPEEDAWYVFQHHLVMQVLKERSSSANRFSSYLNAMPAEKQAAIKPLFDNLARWMAFLDDDAHRKLRKPVQSAFDSKMVKKWDEWLYTSTEALIKDAKETGAIEVLGEVALPLPLRLICEILGIPEEKGFEIKERYLSIAKFLDNSTDPEIARAAMTDEGIIHNYMLERIEASRHSSAVNLLTYMVEVQEKHPDLSDKDIASNCIFLMGAGHETTTSSIATAVLLAYSRPEWIPRLRDDEAFRMGLVEEALRLHCPLQRTSRTTRTDQVLDGIPIPAGQRICVLLGAAGRDPAAFEKPEEVNPERKPNPHLGFSAGPHFCAGARVARMEVARVLEIITQYCGDYTLSERSLSWQENLTFRSLTELYLDPPTGGA